MKSFEVSPDGRSASIQLLKAPTDSGRPGPRRQSEESCPMKRRDFLKAISAARGAGLNPGLVVDLLFGWRRAMVADITLVDGVATIGVSNVEPAAFELTPVKTQSGASLGVDRKGHAAWSRSQRSATYLPFRHAHILPFGRPDPMHRSHVRRRSLSRRTGRPEDRW
jgi:hypothetical protein